MRSRRLDIRTEIMLGRRAQGSTLSQGDVGCPLSAFEGFGLVLATDVGKRVWARPYGLVIENAEQLAMRTKLVFGDAL